MVTWWKSLAVTTSGVPGELGGELHPVGPLHRAQRATVGAPEEGDAHRARVVVGLEAQRLDAGVLEDGVVQREVVEAAVGAAVHRLEHRQLRIGDEVGGGGVVAPAHHLATHAQLDEYPAAVGVAGGELVPGEVGDPDLDLHVHPGGQRTGGRHHLHPGRRLEAPHRSVAGGGEVTGERGQAGIGGLDCRQAPHVRPGEGVLRRDSVR